MYAEALSAVRVERRVWNSEAGNGPRWEQWKVSFLVSFSRRDGEANRQADMKLRQSRYHPFRVAWGGDASLYCR